MLSDCTNVVASSLSHVNGKMRIEHTNILRTYSHMFATPNRRCQNCCRFRQHAAHSIETVAKWFVRKFLGGDTCTRMNWRNHFYFARIEAIGQPPKFVWEQNRMEKEKKKPVSNADVFASNRKLYAWAIDWICFSAKFVTENSEVF